MTKTLSTRTISLTYFRNAAFASMLLVWAAVTLGAQTSGMSDDGAVPTVAHNTWTSGAPMPTAVMFPMVAVLGGQIYVVGGATGGTVGTVTGIVADTQVFDPATNAWSTGVPLPTPLCAGAAAVVDGALYVIGGVLQDGTTYTNAVWAFNPRKKAWSAKSPLPTATVSMGVVVENGIIYVIGGLDEYTDRLNTVESYDPATDSWTEEAPLLVGKSNSSVGLVGTTIVAADGFGQPPSDDTGDNEGYDASTNTWTSLTADPTPRDGTCGGSIGGHMYVAGGYYGNDDGPDMNFNEAFNLSKNSWKTLAPMPQATLASGSAVYKKQLYCLGGVASYQGGVLDNVQIYQP
jgi:N-acetylneuraminic acid mutarotase